MRPHYLFVVGLSYLDNKYKDVLQIILPVMSHPVIWRVSSISSSNQYLVAHFPFDISMDIRYFSERFIHATNTVHFCLQSAIVYRDRGASDERSIQNKSSTDRRDICPKE
jgi:hypothetical protein